MTNNISLLTEANQLSREKLNVEMHNISNAGNPLRTKIEPHQDNISLNKVHSKRVASNDVRDVGLYGKLHSEVEAFKGSLKNMKNISNAFFDPNNEINFVSQVNKFIETLRRTEDFNNSPSKDLRVQTIVEEMQNVLSKLRQFSSEVLGWQKDNEESVLSNVNSVNSLLDDLHSINRTILNGSNQNAAEDYRDNKLAELGKYIGFNLIKNNRNSNVFDINLANYNSSNLLDSKGPKYLEYNKDLQAVCAGGNAVQFNSGALKGNNDIAEELELLTTQLNSLAANFAEVTNTTFNQGFSCNANVLYGNKQVDENQIISQGSIRVISFRDNGDGKYQSDYAEVRDLVLGQVVSVSQDIIIDCTGRTVQEVIDEINDSNLNLTAELESGKLKVSSHDPLVGRVALFDINEGDQYSREQAKGFAYQTGLNDVIVADLKYGNKPLSSLNIAVNPILSNSPHKLPIMNQNSLIRDDNSKKIDLEIEGKILTAGDNNSPFLNLLDEEEDNILTVNLLQNPGNLDADVRHKFSRNGREISLYYENRQNLQNVVQDFITKLNIDNSQNAEAIKNNFEFTYNAGTFTLKAKKGSGLAEIEFNGNNYGFNKDFSQPTLISNDLGLLNDLHDNLTNQNAFSGEYLNNANSLNFKTLVNSMLDKMQNKTDVIKSQFDLADSNRLNATSERDQKVKINKLDAFYKIKEHMHQQLVYDITVSMLMNAEKERLNRLGN